ncbi:hypothetical protein [Roseobacter weihaiensis]|uniref:hypothetical protein n=1 Tax=Roseobacter weihaiensis TaxID=2763262 RepID=UPI001D0B4D6E|nr:hypothetical protein [Roseobacter sp. H9]
MNSSNGIDIVKNPAFIRKQTETEAPFLRKYKDPFRIIDGEEHWAIPNLSHGAKQAIRVYSRSANVRWATKRLLSPFLKQQCDSHPIGETDKKQIYFEHFAKDRQRCDELVYEISCEWFSG